MIVACAFFRVIGKASKFHGVTVVVSMFFLQGRFPPIYCCQDWDEHDRAGHHTAPGQPVCLVHFSSQNGAGDRAAGQQHFMDGGAQGAVMAARHTMKKTVGVGMSSHETGG